MSIALLSELGLTQKRCPNPIKKGAFQILLFLRRVKGNQGFRFSRRKFCEYQQEETA
jgi:hypothetical protein